jgi:lipoprotein-anchoring transpeptidase ErfK/SrfK
VRIDSRGLQNRLIAAITGLTAANIRVRAVKTQPKIKMADLEERYPTVLVIDRPGFKLRLYRRLRHVRTYGIAIGQAGYDTPAGEYSITDKAVNPNWYVPNAAWTGSLAGQVIPGGAANNPLKSRWLGFGEGRGIHGTAETGSIGTAASHGCIRMLIPEVEELYPRVPVGAPLFVV